MSQIDTTPVEPEVEMKKERGYREEVQVMGEQLLTKVKEVLHEGNVRRIIIRHEGQTVMELPLTVGVVSVLAMPQLVAIGAISALLAQYSIEVVRFPESKPAVYQSPRSRPSSQGGCMDRKAACKRLLKEGFT